MGKYNNQVRSLDEYINCLRAGKPYDGYVEGLGYASSESRALPPRTTSRYVYDTYNIYHECRLEMSKDTIRKLDGSKIFERQEQEQEQNLSGKIMNITLAASMVLVADDASVIGVADDVAIPFILAGGCIIALVAYLVEGNTHYPGPWVTTQPAPWSPQAVPPEPQPTPPDDHIPNEFGGLGLVIGGSMLMQNFQETTGGLIRNKRAGDIVNRPKIDKHLRDSLMEHRLIQLSEEFEKRFIPARDATRIESPKRILLNERK
jgi:hypothetical protein